MAKLANAIHFVKAQVLVRGLFRTCALAHFLAHAGSEPPKNDLNSISNFYLGSTRN
jgi:hypothetical protein